MTSVTSYQDWKYDYSSDFDGTELNLLAALTRGAANGGLNQAGPYHSRQFTQELRLASNGDGNFNYLGGLYYSHSTNDRSFNRGPVVAVGKWSATGGNKSIAAFTQLDYQLTEATRLSGGLRANKETIEVRFTDLLPAVPRTFVGDSSDNAVTGKVSLQHDLAKKVMVYGSFATGYKGAGFDISSGFNQSRIDHVVAPESSKAYEVGIKSRFFQDRVQLNATAFLTDYDDFQAQAGVIDPNTGALVLSVHNVGKLRTRGVELELSAKPVRSLLLEASVGYVDAIIRKFPMGTCYPGQTLALGCVPLGNSTVQDLAGKRLANAPKVKYNVGATYDFPLGNSGWGGLVNLNYQYQSKVNFDLFQNPLTVQEAYGILNGSFALQDDGKKYKVTFFGNNLTNKSYTTAIADGFGFFGGSHLLTQVLPRNSQRYYGVRLNYSF